MGQTPEGSEDVEPEDVDWSRPDQRFPLDMPEPRDVHVRQIEISGRVEKKIRFRGITRDHVLDAFQRPAVPIEAAWESDDGPDDRGLRLSAIGKDATGRLLYCVLYPVDISDGCWRLGTCHV